MQHNAMHQINPQGQSNWAALDPIWDLVRKQAEDIVLAASRSVILYLFDRSSFI